MADVKIKTLQTRISLKHDSFENWQKSTLTLLPGELAICEIPGGVQELKDASGNVIERVQTAPTVLFKVGDDSKKTFKDLPWASAKAADVYAWAKTANAEDVLVEIVPDSQKPNDKVTKTLSAWLLENYTKINKNAADIAANKQALDTLNGTEADLGSILYTVKDKISDALALLKFEDTDATEDKTTTGKLSYVTSVTQTNGQIAVTKRALTTADLPEISTSLIKTGETGDTETLDKKLGKMSSDIAALDKFNDDLKATSTGEGNYVTGVTYTNGEIKVTKGGIVAGDVGTDAIADGAVITAKIADGNVTTDKLADSAVTDAKINTVSASKVIYTPEAEGKPAVTLPAKIAEVEGQIASINLEIAGGVHFLGVTTTDIPKNSSNGSVTIDTKTVEASLGDVVIYGTREFIWSGTKWEELGDVSRIGALESKVNDLNYDGTGSGAHKFVTKVTQVEGQIAAEYAQPTGADIKYNDTQTVEAAIAANTAAIAENAKDISEHKHPEYENQNAFSNIKVGDETVAADTATDTVEFAGTNVAITVDATNDKITFEVAEGSLTTKGIVKLSDSEESDSSETAATSKAVSIVNAKIAAVEENYIKVQETSTGSGKYEAKVNDELIIFDCGGASGN